MNYYPNRHPFVNPYYMYPPHCHHASPYPYQPMENMMPMQMANVSPLEMTNNAYANYDCEEAVAGVTDHGNEPYVLNIHRAARGNRAFRRVIWTGEHLQVTLMSIDVGEDIGLEVHPEVDQFLRIEDGEGFVQMGSRRNQLTYERYVQRDDAIVVPAGTWHNLTNTGNRPLKLYAIYAPPEHPAGTVHRTKAEAVASEQTGNYSK